MSENLEIFLNNAIDFIRNNIISENVVTIGISILTGLLIALLATNILSLTLAALLTINVIAMVAQYFGTDTLTLLARFVDTEVDTLLNWWYESGWFLGVGLLVLVAVVRTMLNIARR